MVHHKERVALISDSYGHPKEELELFGGGAGFVLCGDVREE